MGHDPKIFFNENHDGGEKRMTKTIYQRVIVVLAFISFSSIGWASGNTANQKEWTVLIYLNADNNLEGAGYSDIHEMENVGSNDNINVVVQFDWESTSGTNRYYIEKNTQPYSKDSHDIHSKLVEELGEQDMGSASTLEDFVEWGMKNYPADHYFVIMWNHGSGWELNQQNINKGISYDDTSGNHIGTNDLADAFLDIAQFNGKKVDVLGFDACLMGMYEIADSLSDSVDYLVASEETIPWDGYPYDDLFNAFFNRDDRSPANFAKDAVDTYGASYSGGSQGNSSITNTAFDLSQMSALKESLNNWIQDIMKTQKISAADLLDASGNTQSYSYSTYRDLGDHVKRVMAKLSAATSEQVQSKAISDGQDLLKAIHHVVIGNFNSDKYKASTGISIYLPYSSYGDSEWSASDGDNSLKQEYMSLNWAKTTDWPLYLDYLFPIPSIGWN